MYTISLKILLFALLFLEVSSCNFGPKPDKIVKITVAFDEKNGSNEEINTVIEILKNRINKISNDSKIERKQDSDQITIEVTTHYDSERIKDLVINEGRLDFYETYNVEEILPFLIETNNLLKKDDGIDPLLDIIKRAEYSSGAILFYASEKDTTMINHYLSFKGAEMKLPAKRRVIRFVWGRQEVHTGLCVKIR
ncbi:hypothetical protein [Aquimarina sp. I32.4]|uniref:hypothetical protein n=1 Tax=Aquimarina sp. I32.4 TaxID=2053903 RepID=UPI000CDE8226|nr:hypothetical protein [Aquimarina sp. I32.4]